MHLSMFSAIALFFGKRAGIKKLTFILRIITLIAFVWFAGFSPSLTRAFICAMLMIVANIAGAKKLIQECSITFIGIGSELGIVVVNNQSGNGHETDL